ncbi:adenylate cyclase [Streptohalobacillus salinus]|uniref:Adenylate cyclase n=1 Tax=Streptohalobacillus salinus TaxID=621096 RepID=A0A2V3WVK8_9BACI|nr:CYTH domain-containing protein [Streptohalobacillus salinus]PXW93132.1 adenylate cyclase [Streptohalobacillus salinus]
MQEIEIELKNLLTKEEFETCLTHYNQDLANAKKQINHYFETPDFQLKARGAALRIREKNNHYTMTLKEPHKDALLETHANMSEAEARQFIHNQDTFPSLIAEALNRLDINQGALIYGGQLRTERLEFEEDGLLIVLDKSHYHGLTDYELEIEGPSVASVEAKLNQLLSQLAISKKQTPNKIARFYQALQQRNANHN